MLNIDELWIGDRVQAIKSGKVGRFEGLNSDNKIRVLVGIKVFLYRPDQLVKLEDIDHSKKKINLKEEALASKLGFVKTAPELDLHIEKLNPNLINALPERIVDFQLKTFEEYLNNAIEDKLAVVMIIHGKGLGVLRTSIHNYLQSTKEVNHFHLKNNDGATEVYFAY